MKILALDRGNTALKAALFEKGDIVWRERLTGADCNQLEHMIAELDAESVVFSSVVPDWTVRVKRVLDSADIDFLEVGSWIRLPFKLLIENPQTLGSDRISLAAGARRLGYGEVVIIDVGTAVTVDLLSERGFEGGSIFPGPDLLLRALRSGTAGLKDVTVKDKRDFLPPGRNTEEAVGSGIIWGSVGAVKEIIGKMRPGGESPLDIVISGGQADFLARFMEPEPVLIPDLLFHGLHLLYEMNR